MTERKQSELSAQISLTPSDCFLAVLSDGQRIECREIDELAAALHAVGIAPNYAYCGDWRQGDYSLTAGQTIALKVELRRLSEHPNPPCID